MNSRSSICEGLEQKPISMLFGSRDAVGDCGCRPSAVETLPCFGPREKLNLRNMQRDRMKAETSTAPRLFESNGNMDLVNYLSKKEPLLGCWVVFRRQLGIREPMRAFSIVDVVESVWRVGLFLCFLCRTVEVSVHVGASRGPPNINNDGRSSCPSHPSGVCVER